MCHVKLSHRADYIPAMILAELMVVGGMLYYRVFIEGFGNVTVSEDNLRRDE